MARIIPPQTKVAQKSTQKISNKNFTFNPSELSIGKTLNPTFDNGISGLNGYGSLVKGPPLADLALPNPQPTITDVLEEWGGTGTIIVGGILSNVDYNPDLTGTQRVLLYDEMRKGDATVRAALLAVKLPILSANWYIKPYAADNKADPTPQDKEIADFIEQQLFSTMIITWNDWLRQCMLYLDYGSMMFEKVFQMLPDGKIGWKKFAPRLTQTIYRWRMPDNATEGITQILPTGGIRGIPKWKLLPFVNEQEGEDYEGISIMRGAYQPWYFKQSMYRIDAIATERQGLGIPYVKVPPGASEQDRAKVDELLRNLRANEQANIQVPVGWEIGFMDMHGGTSQIKDASKMILHYDRQISKSVLAQFIELGGQSTGSFALSANQSELFLLSLQSHAKKIRETLNNDAIKELVDLNFQVQPDKYPTLEFSRIGTVDFEKLSMALFRLAQGGLITASPELEKYLAEAMSLPEPIQDTANEGDSPTEEELPVPAKVQKMQKPVQVYSKEQMIHIENKYASELNEIKDSIGYDVRELKREIEDIIRTKK